MISSMFRPPSFMGRCSVDIAILGAFSWPHMNLLMIFVNAFSIWLGIPWAFARNWVWPPMTAWIIRRLPFIVRWAFSHVSSLGFILSITCSHGVASFTLLPIQAPRILIASLSRAMWISFGSGFLSSEELAFGYGASSMGGGGQTHTKRPPKACQSFVAATVKLEYF